MKKLQSFFCIALLSTTLVVGNVSAFSGVATPSFSVFGDVIRAVVALLRGENCPPRQCQNCRPTERDEHGNCRPSES